MPAADITAEQQIELFRRQEKAPNNAADQHTYHAIIDAIRDGEIMYDALEQTLELTEKGRAAQLTALANKVQRSKHASRVRPTEKRRPARSKRGKR